MRQCDETDRHNIAQELEKDTPCYVCRKIVENSFFSLLLGMEKHRRFNFNYDVRPS
jgi:hypothetical protein